MRRRIRLLISGEATTRRELPSEAVDLYVSGWTVFKISQKYGCAEATVRNRLAAQGVPLRGKTKILPAYAVIRQAYDDGMTLEQIGREYGVSRQAVHQAVHKGLGQ